MRRRRFLAALALAAVSCTNGGASPSTSTTIATTTTTTVAATTTTLASRVDNRLVLGVMAADQYPDLTAAVGAGVELAIADVNDAGGVLGAEVTWAEADIGPEGPVGAFERLIRDRADVVIGAPGSSDSEAIIPLAVEEGAVIVSPTNSAPELSAVADHGLFFRTTASDALQGTALARVLIDSGVVDSVSVLHRDDNYGRAIAEHFAADFTALGGTGPDVVPYDPEQTPAMPATSRSGTVVLIGLDEAATILEALRATGSPDIWVTEPAFGLLADNVDAPALLAGVHGLVHLPFPDMPQEFFDRLQDSSRQPTVLSYAAEAYDAVVISALATRLAAGDYPDEVAGLIPDVTRDGEVCTSFAACVELIDAGNDIDYDGLSGHLDLDDSGEPTVASWEWSRYDESGEMQAPIGTVTVDR